MKPRGPKSAKIAIVLNPDEDAIEADDILSIKYLRILANALARARVSMDDCYLIPADERTKDEIETCESVVVIPVGDIALCITTGLTGANNTSGAWRGYVVDPSIGGYRRGTLKGIIPTLELRDVAVSGFRIFDWFERDILGAIKFANAPASPVFGIGTTDFDYPESVSRLALDLETVGFTGAIERIGLAWDGGARTDPWDRKNLRQNRLLESSCLKIVQNAAFDYPLLLAEGIKLGGPLWDTMYGMQLVDPDSPGFDLNRMVSWAMLARRHKHLGSPKTKPRFKLQTWKREFICANFREEGKKCYGKGKPALQGAGKGDKRICKKCVIARFQQELQAWEKASIDYNRQDAAVLLPIQSKQRVILAQRGQLDLFETMMDVLQHVLLPMQIRGLETDPKVRIELTNEYKQKSETYQQEWDALTGGVNESSTPQMRKLVYETWRLPTQYKMKKDKKTGGRIRTVALDNEAIENLVALEDTPQKYRDGLRLLQRLKQAKKWYETYVDCGQRIFPRYGPAKKEGSGSVRAAAMAATGRIIAKGGDNADGSKTPPIQQFPEPMKRLIIPDRGLFLALDYSQEELRIIAYLANDEKLIHMIETGEDIHAANAEAFGCDRTRAKNLFYGAIYGAKPRALVHELRAHGFDLTMDDASNFLRLARKLYPQVFAWHDQICQQADRLHYITDPFGGRRNFAARDTRYSEVLNFPVQSTGSRMQWLRLREIYDAARARESDLSILQFDSIVLDTSKERVLDLAAVMKEILERPFPQVHPKFYCPVDIKVGPNWGDMEKLVI